MKLFQIVLKCEDYDQSEYSKFPSNLVKTAMNLTAFWYFPIDL